MSQDAYNYYLKFVPKNMFNKKVPYCKITSVLVTKLNNIYHIKTILYNKSKINIIQHKF